MQEVGPWTTCHLLELRNLRLLFQLALNLCPLRRLLLYMSASSEDTGAQYRAVQRQKGGDIRDGGQKEICVCTLICTYWMPFLGARRANGWRRCA